jgi:hypothetical protein
MGELGGAVMIGFLWSAEGLGSETSEPSYGPAPPLLSGAELPSFRYPLGASRPRPSPAARPRKRTSQCFPSPTSLPAST